MNIFTFLLKVWSSHILTERIEREFKDFGRDINIIKENEMESVQYLVTHSHRENFQELLFPSHVKFGSLRALILRAPLNG